MEPVLIGYFAKEPFDPGRASGLLRPVADICSVSECIVSGATDWVQKWLHNSYSSFDSEELALAVVPGEHRRTFQLFAYRVFPVLFQEGIEVPLRLPALDVEPLPPEYLSIGYDVVQADPLETDKSRVPSYGFGCSPLTCNGLADEVPVNRHCLFDSTADAFELARKVSASDGPGEPGDYLVVEVLRKQQNVT